MDKKWIILEPNEKDLKESLLKNRKIEDSESFFKPHLNKLSPADKLLPEIEKAVQRVKKAIKEKELIYIYGDFDVDGITATAILWETIDYLGGKVLPYIPHREKEGYGIHPQALEALAKEGAKIIVSVDCGITAVEEAKLAKKLQLDLIITDHHTKQKEIPTTFALLHTDKLAGCGVAFMLAKELLASFGEENSEQVTKNLELAAIGTIADMVPLIEDNRVIVSNGLFALTNTNRFGLKALYDGAGIKVKISSYEVGFLISPRLNSMGRMENALDSLRLLLTRKMDRAKELALKISKTNSERQQALSRDLEHARVAIDKDTKAKMLVINHESYTPGVIGLVASRLVDEFYRPSIVISQISPIGKGSARSVSGFHITEALTSAKEFLTGFGGHPMAAGFSIPSENVEAFREKMLSHAEKNLKSKDLIPTLKIDARLPSEKINFETREVIKDFEPFGIGNPEPVFSTNDLEISDIRTVGVDGKHAKMVFRSMIGNVIPGIGFGFGKNGFKVGDKVDAAYNLIEDTWQGEKKVQIKIKDMKKKK